MRVVGTPEARKAWIALRGSFFLAYLTLIFIAFSVDPITWVGWVWKIALIGSSAAAAVGSIASWRITGRGALGRHLPGLEALEVTGLRVMVGLEFLYAISIFFILHPTMVYIVLHLGIGFFALGILMNMTWNKGHRHGAEGA